MNKKMLMAEKICNLEVSPFIFMQYCMLFGVLCFIASHTLHKLVFINILKIFWIQKNNFIGHNYKFIAFFS